MRPLIVANWKCNPKSLAEAKKLFNVIKKTKAIICPPYPYLHMGNPKSEIRNSKLGAQDCFWEQEGAFTGEISPKMLKDLGCKYVIIGHSERRKYFNETDEMVNKKLLAAFEARLKPILCIGEKEGEEMDLVVKNQLLKGLKNIGNIQMRDLIIAYEPVWAIGTGNPCKPEDAIKAASFIRNILTKLYNKKLAEETLIIYGGSVDSKIARDYIKAGFDGLLVGGASLNAKEFRKIVKNA